MYVGLLMLSNVSKLNFDDIVGAMSGLICAVFIVLTANIVTGIMLGFATLVIGRIVSGDAKTLKRRHSGDCRCFRWHSTLVVGRFKSFDKDNKGA